MPDLNWVPAPRYILRRHRVLELLKDRAPCRVLDIGCGPGALISELSERGYEAVGVDRSAKARELGEHLREGSDRLHLHADLDERWVGTFDLLLSLEVIEHVKDDRGALSEWRRYLKPGGSMILSTPAHHRRWNSADEWAGHVRRYERDELVKTIERSGFKVERVESLGFPLANIIDMLSAPVYRRKLQSKTATHHDAAALTDDSGSDRSTHARFWPLYSSRISAAVLDLFCRLQTTFRDGELGPGFIVTAKVA
jgi:SAM-dependent methyltransferase